MESWASNINWNDTVHWIPNLTNEEAFDSRQNTRLIVFQKPLWLSYKNFLPTYNIKLELTKPFIKFMNKDVAIFNYLKCYCIKVFFGTWWPKYFKRGRICTCIYSSTNAECYCHSESPRFKSNIQIYGKLNRRRLSAVNIKPFECVSNIKIKSPQKNLRPFEGD